MGETSKIRGRWPAVIGSIVMLAGLLGPAGEASAATAKADIVGRITAVGSGEPLAGIDVVLYNATITKPYRTVYTDANGRYRFAGVGYKKYTIRAGLRDRDVYATFYGNTVHYNRARIIDVRRHATYTRNIRIEPATSVTGTVLDPQGRPVAGGEIGGFNLTRTGGRNHVTINAHGRFRIRSLAPGPVLLDYFWPGVTDSSGSRTVQRTVQAVRGRSVDVTIRVPGDPATGAITGDVVSAPAGSRLDARNLSTGEDWWLDIGSGGHVDERLPVGRWRVGFKGSDVGSTVTVAESGVATFGRLRYPARSATITGQVVHADGTPCNHCTVEAWDGNGWLFDRARSDSRGRYVVSGAAAGRQVLRVLAHRRRSGPGSHLETRRAVTVPEGAPGVTKKITLVEGYTLKGVVLHDGKPVRGVDVWDADAPGAQDVTDRLGRFTLRYVRSGTVRVRLSESVLGGYLDKTVTVKVSGKSRSGIRLSIG